MAGIMEDMKNKVVDNMNKDMDNTVCSRAFAMRMNWNGKKDVIGVVQLGFLGVESDPKNPRMKAHKFTAHLYIQDEEASARAGKICMEEIKTGGYFGVNQLEYEACGDYKKYAMYLLDNFQMCCNIQYGYNMDINKKPISRKEMDDVAKALDNRKTYLESLYEDEENDDEIEDEDENEDDDEYENEDSDSWDSDDCPKIVMQGMY